MATLKKETRWAVSKTVFTAKEMDVLLDEEGKIVQYSDKNEEEYYKPEDSVLFFSTKEEAERVKIELIPHNQEQVKRYLDYLYEGADYDEIKNGSPPVSFDVLS